MGATNVKNVIYPYFMLEVLVNWFILIVLLTVKDTM